MRLAYDTTVGRIELAALARPTTTPRGVMCLVRVSAMSVKCRIAHNTYQRCWCRRANNDWLVHKDSAVVRKRSSHLLVRLQVSVSTKHAYPHRHFALHEEASKPDLRGSHHSPISSGLEGTKSNRWHSHAVQTGNLVHETGQAWEQQVQQRFSTLKPEHIHAVLHACFCSDPGL